MEALFFLQATYRVTGQIKDGDRVTLKPGKIMLAERFEASVFPRTPALGLPPRLVIDRFITVTGRILTVHGDLRSVRGKATYWLSEPGNPGWVLALVRRIEETECPHPQDPEPMVF